MLSDEEKYAIDYLKIYIERDVMYENRHYKQIEIILNLIEKQSKEIEELKEGFKIQEHNYQVAMKEIEYKWKDEIKAKIEPVLKQLERKMEEEYNKYGNSREYQDIVDAYNFLQSLLEKE